MTIPIHTAIKKKKVLKQITCLFIFAKLEWEKNMNKNKRMYTHNILNIGRNEAT